MDSLVAGIQRDEAEPDCRSEQLGAVEKGALSVTSGQFGLWAFLATVAMLFAGFTSAYLVRQATGSDWNALPLPPVLWVNTAVLLASSATLERGRTLSRTGRREALRRWLPATVLLGLAFLAGQLWAWQRLAAHGIFLSTNPHSSFFYVLTGVHAVHLLGGIAALTAALVAAWGTRPSPQRDDPLKLCALYWHFVDGAWLYLFFMLFVL